MHSKTDKIFKILPSLRRYALALSGTEAKTDDVLEGAIEWMIDNSHLDQKNFEHFGVAGCRISWFNKEPNDLGTISQNITDSDDSLVSKAIVSKLNVLPFYQRRCLILTAVAGKSYSEIAALENIPRSNIGDYISQARIALIEGLIETSCTDFDEESTSLEWCSDRHLNALLDNELSASEASLTRNALGFDKKLAKRLEQLALVDTLIASNVASDAVENDITAFYNPLQTIVNEPSAYLH